MCLSYFSWISSAVWNLFPFKVILVLGKAKSCRAPNLGCSRAKSPGWFDVSPKNSPQDVMHEQGRCHDEAANHQLPIAPAFWIIQIVSTEECSGLTQNLMQICCSTCSVILNVTATQYTCSLNGIYHLHWLVQWSCHCSRMRIPVYSPWLPGYIGVAQTVLLILINNGLNFPGQASYIHVNIDTCIKMWDVINQIVNARKKYLWVAGPFKHNLRFI